MNVACGKNVINSSSTQKQYHEEHAFVKITILNVTAITI